ncbi:MAG: response regulator [Theionarchaea archaeon]|nr:response regulator [Theionarchaea archaeon]
MGRLLVVDDDRITLDVLKDILEHKGHDVSTAISGETAISTLSEQDFDLVLVDLKMKGTSGFDVIRFVKEKHPNIIVIVLTGYGSLDYAVEALRLGAYDFFQKPVEPELVINAVERGLEKKQLKEFSEAVIKKMDEGLTMLDSEGIMIFTNERLPEMLGYPQEEVMGRPFLSMISPEDERNVDQCLRQAQHGEPQRLQACLVRRDGAELFAIVSFTSIGNQILTVVSDVTSIVKPPFIGEDFSYKIEPARLYLIGEEKSEKSIEALRDLIRVGYKGTVITRKYPDEIRKEIGKDVHVMQLTEELSGESALFPDITLIERKLQTSLSRNRVVFIDRLDYLISKNTFDSVLSSVQRIRDTVFLKKGIVILSVDPRTLKEREFSLLEKETLPLVPISKPELREDLLELLIFVANRNEVGVKPHHREIEKKFNITRATVRQRIGLLLIKGLIVEKKRGRTKVVEITEKGKKTIT